MSHIKHGTISDHAAFVAIAAAAMPLSEIDLWYLLNSFDDFVAIATTVVSSRSTPHLPVPVVHYALAMLPFQVMPNCHRNCYSEYYLKNLKCFDCVAGGPKTLQRHQSCWDPATIRIHYLFNYRYHQLSWAYRCAYLQPPSRQCLSDWHR